MSRTFTVRGSRQVTEYVTWKVEADSFDEAEAKVRDGWYDDCDVDDSETTGDTEIEDVECYDCGGGESYCDCDESEEEFDETRNPNWDSGVAARDLEPGQWIVPDAYTHDRFPESEPVRVLEVYGLDSDGDRRIRFERATGSADYWYVDEAARFEVVDAPEEAAELEAKRAEVERKLNEEVAVAQLLRI